MEKKPWTVGFLREVGEAFELVMNYRNKLPYQFAHKLTLDVLQLISQRNFFLYPMNSLISMPLLRSVNEKNDRKKYKPNYKQADSKRFEKFLNSIDERKLKQNAI
jgi:hypothetical protein